MDTFGWDTVSVLTIKQVNQSLLRNQEKLVMQFDTKHTSQLPLQARGQYSDWQVVEGGSGAILYLKMAIAPGSTVTYDGGAPIDISGLAMVAAVQLALMPRKDTPSIEELRFQFTQVGEIGTPPPPGTITPVNLQGAEGRLDPAQATLLMIALASYLVAKAEALNYVFATVNLVPAQSNSWLTPVKSAYMYLNRVGSPGALAILSVTTDRDISGLPLNIDGALLSHSYDASFGISKALFLQNVLQPSLPAVFGNGASHSSFVYNAADQTLCNTRGLGMNGVTWGAITYYPVVNYFRMTTTGAGIASHYEGSCDLKAGLSMKFWVDTHNQAVYNAGIKSFSFLPDPNPSSRDEADIPWYWWFLGPIARGIMELIVQAISSSIASSMTADVSQYMTLTRQPPTSIQWNGLQKLDIQDAALNQGFYMLGTPLQA